MVQILKAQNRTNFSKSNLHDIRKKGNLPAVIYGAEQESTPITVNLKALKKIISTEGRNGVIAMQLEGKQQHVMIKDYQYDSLKNEYIHVDFLVVQLSQYISAAVPLKLVGTPKGVKVDGGILQQVLYELNVTAKPKELPEKLEVDVTDLVIGDTLTVSDLMVDQEIELNQEAEEVIASVLVPKIEEASSEMEETEEEAEELV